MIGMFATSRAGHDKDIVYIIIREESEYVYLVDGKCKTIDKPKKKNKKHIQIIKKYCDDSLKMKLLQNKTIYNEEIRKAIGGNVCQKQM